MTAAEPGAGRRPHGPDHPPARLFWPLVGLGWTVMIAGAWGLVSEAGRTRPAEAARFVLGAVAAHDLVVAPVVVVAGWALARVVPARVRGPVQSALIVSAVVALFSVPFVRGYGRFSANPSILPRNYGNGLAAILATVWVIAGAVVARRRWSARRRSDRSPRRRPAATPRPGCPGPPPS